MRLAHLSDIHFGGEDKAATEAAVLATHAFAPDLVVVTGDLTLNGLPREFAAARDWLARLPRPQLVTPGNHDTPYWNLVLRTFTPFDRYRRYIGSPDHAEVAVPGLAAQAINTARGPQPRLNWSKGAISLDSVKRAAAQIRAAKGCLSVLACHHPLVELEGAPVSGGVRGGVAAADMIADARIDLILTGHVHNPFALVLPHGDHNTYAVGAGTLSLRTRGTPCGFSTIETDATDIEVTALGWTGSAFELHRRWMLPRRR